MKKQYIFAFLLVGLAGTALTQRQIEKKGNEERYDRQKHAAAQAHEKPIKFARLFQESGLQLSSGVQHTIFAPRDSVFTESLEKKLSNMTQQEKQSLVKRHIVVGDIRLGAIDEGEMETKSMSGDVVEIEIDAHDDIEVNDAHVVACDIIEDESDSTIHVIDALLEHE